MDPGLRFDRVVREEGCCCCCCCCVFFVVDVVVVVVVVVTVAIVVVAIAVVVVVVVVVTVSHSVYDAGDCDMDEGVGCAEDEGSNDCEDLVGEEDEEDAPPNDRNRQQRAGNQPDEQIRRTQNQHQHRNLRVLAICLVDLPD